METRITPFEALCNQIEQDKADYTERDRYAVYGYCYAYHDLEEITTQEFDDLRRRLLISDEDAEDLLV